MNKYFALLLMVYSAPSFSWTLTDKVLYDNYSNCLNHKLKDVDISKTNLGIARQAFVEDCRKAFCVEKMEVTEDEYNSCISQKHISCKSGQEEYDVNMDQIERAIKSAFACDRVEEYCREKKYRDSTCISEVYQKF